MERASGSEIRRPKAEVRKKAEGRRANGRVVVAEWASTGAASISYATGEKKCGAGEQGE